MSDDLLNELSNADAIAANEQEVRDIVLAEGKKYCDEVLYDNLGSIIFHKKGTDQNGVKMLFCAHMDEVGFVIRSISDIGLLYLMPVGNVKNNTQDMQLVRITTYQGNKIYGVLNTSRDDQNQITESYVDIGVDSANDVLNLGIDVGDMVTFASDYLTLSQKVIAGKALDDRTGIDAEIKAMQKIFETKNDLYFAMTSSEEVGTRGGKTVTELVNPDIIFAIDVANGSEIKRDFSNKRKIGHGLMIEHYDKTMTPNRKLIHYLCQLCRSENIAFQDDMMKGGGTDAGNAHLTGIGKLAAVLGIPLRYCHGSYSLANKDDIESASDLMVAIAKNMNRSKYETLINFRGE